MDFKHDPPPRDSLAAPGGADGFGPQTAQRLREEDRLARAQMEIDARARKLEAAEKKVEEEHLNLAQMEKLKPEVYQQLQKELLAARQINDYNKRQLEIKTIHDYYSNLDRERRLRELEERVRRPAARPKAKSPARPKAKSPARRKPKSKSPARPKPKKKGSRK